ncbi:hypothetical protein CIL05_05210 [Virgibacillus profundi]|uniref:DUF3021 domain-containing protein n=1 Tax=Virgibacillus profundi TaxID=2024555 RepID=A0A2A2IGX5_9BACI|nr:DUF3021 domain-containing protein [Virgibacillus profundi]PAV30504.1 hypothetical protein CIL05_05210 [Virgibacillus profundi]PXY54676.1 DUF3021 domain-containing protein [Virgibacillus profundi]
MILEIIKRSMIGIAIGGIFTFIALTIMKFNGFESTVSEIWMHMGASFLIGIYFGISSLIFGNDDSNMLQKTVIHLIASLTVWYIIALSVGWIPFTIVSIIISTLIFILMYMLNWAGYYLYYKKVEASLNEHLQNKK